MKALDDWRENVSMFMFEGVHSLLTSDGHTMGFQNGKTCVCLFSNFNNSCWGLISFRNPGDVRFIHRQERLD